MGISTEIHLSKDQELIAASGARVIHRRRRKVEYPSEVAPTGAKIDACALRFHAIEKHVFVFPGLWRGEREIGAGEVRVGSFAAHGEDYATAARANARAL